MPDIVCGTKLGRLRRSLTKNQTSLLPFFEKHWLHINPSFDVRGFLRILSAKWLENSLSAHRPQPFVTHRRNPLYYPWEHAVQLFVWTDALLNTSFSGLLSPLASPYMLAYRTCKQYTVSLVQAWPHQKIHTIKQKSIYIHATYKCCFRQCIVRTPFALPRLDGLSAIESFICGALLQTRSTFAR